MKRLNTLKEQVEYFNQLLQSNIERAKSQKTAEEKEEAVFYNLNIKLDGTELIFYTDENDCVYTLYKDDIYKMYKLGLEKNSTETMKTDEFMIYSTAVHSISKLEEYSRKKITFEELINANSTPSVVKKLLEQKSTITEQLKLLRSNRNIPEVQEYINNVSKQNSCTEYVKYLIDKYYYGKKNLIKPEKTGLECFGKIVLS